MHNIYYKSLQNKKWIEKRKLVLERDNNKCTICGNTQNLCVHHTFYWSNKYCPAYDYPISSLITLCSSCHKEYHLNCETPKKTYVKKVYKKKNKRKPIKSKREKLLDKLSPKDRENQIRRDRVSGI